MTYIYKKENKTFLKFKKYETNIKLSWFFSFSDTKIWGLDTYQMKIQYIDKSYFKKKGIDCSGLVSYPK